MTIEITLLQALSNKDNFNNYRHLIKNESLSSQSVIILEDFRIYFEQYSTLVEVDFAEFKPFFFQIRHPYLSETDRVEYKEIFKMMVESDYSKSIQDLLIGFEQQKLYDELKRDLDKNIPLEALVEKVEAFEASTRKVKIIDRPKMDLRLAHKALDRSKGLEWKHPKIAQHLPALVKGDFYVVAGYTNSGKTSFLADNITNMAKQLNDDEYILWLNNENGWERVVNRLYCAALECTQEDHRDNPDQAIALYTEMMKGDSDRIQVLDIQGKHIKDVERLVKERPPKLLILDMLDNIKGFDKYTNKEGSNERYGKLYQWALELASQNCPIIATSQLNREGANIMYPDITNLKGSGVDKQGAAVVILMIGRLNGQQGIRYFSTPKFKLGSDETWKCQLQFDGARSIFL